MSEYKVWVQIEEYDEEEDDYRDLDEPIDIAIFDTEDQARDFVARLESLLEVLHG